MQAFLVNEWQRRQTSFRDRERLIPIACIVEGHGDREALPVLIRRIAPEIGENIYFHVFPPIRVKKQRFLRYASERERYVRLAAKYVKGSGAIVVLLDSDDDCPREIAPGLAEELAGLVPDTRVCVVFATREYEAWFLAALDSLRKTGLIASDAFGPPRPEEIRGAKQWLSGCMTRAGGYRETLHQASFSAIVDLHMARQRARSLDKLWRDLEVVAK